jgi:hypothetical protein
VRRKLAKSMTCQDNKIAVISVMLSANVVVQTDYTNARTGRLDRDQKNADKQANRSCGRNTNVDANVAT